MFWEKRHGLYARERGRQGKLKETRFAHVENASVPKAAALLGTAMDTLFKITFGVLLGIVGCFAWDFYQAQQAALRGLGPGWVPLDSPVHSHRPVVEQANKNTPAASAATEPKQALNASPSPVPPAPIAKKSTPQPAQPTKQNIALADLARLANERHRWPRTVRTVQKFEVPLISDGKQVGKIPLESGTEIELLQVLGDGRLTARVGKLSFYVSASTTDVMQRALPVGTLPPRPKPISTQPQTQVPATKPAPENSSDRQPPGKGTTTLFGTRYDSGQDS